MDTGFGISRALNGTSIREIICLAETEASCLAGTLHGHPSKGQARLESHYSFGQQVSDEPCPVLDPGSIKLVEASQMNWLERGGLVGSCGKRKRQNG